MLKKLSQIIAIKSMSSRAGGDGEGKRADFLEELLKGWGLKPKRYDYKDNRNVKRSNIVVKHGDKKRTLWILAHIDTVAVGDINLWETDPFKAVVKDGKIYGRGTQDNGQGVICGLYALKALLKRKALKYNYGLVLAADEETGSVYGIQKLLKEGIFGKGDMFLVPDSGNPEGSHIEIAEKSILWLKFTVTGKQVHASIPNRGINAFMEGAKLGLALCDFLEKKYNNKQPPFESKSTFVMTMHEKNIDSINIIPGKEVFYMDCRVLPQYSLSGIMDDIRSISGKCKAKVAIEIVQREAAPKPTSANAEVVRLLKGTLKAELGINARLIGIGGGTIAAYLRKAGYDAVVWGIEEDVAHKPNEYAKIANIEKMIKVFTSLF